MNTRQGSKREVEAKLKLALQKLEQTMDINSKLLLEREESELEISKVIDKNTQLKSQLLSKDTELADLLDQQKHLQTISDTHTQCEVVLEEAFGNIRALQKKLAESQVNIGQMQQIINQRDQTKILDLYDQLINQKPVVTIDLTSFSEDTNHTNEGMSVRKCNKRKHVRRKKGKQNTKYKNVILGLRKDRVKLKKEISDYEYIMDNYEQNYSENTGKIKRLESDLQNMHYKYYLAQSEIKERIAAIDELLRVSSYNLELAESIVDGAVNIAEDLSEGSTQPFLLQSPVSYLSSKQAGKTSTKEREIASHVTDGTVKVFCDSIGVDFGSILINHTNSLVINHCLSNTSYSHLIDQVLNEKHEKGTDIVIMMGDSTSVTKVQLTHSIEKLLKVLSLGSVGKIVISAFPYSNRLSVKQNQRIHKLNNILNNLIAFNCYGNELTFFDINKYIYNFILTPSTLNLSKTQKHDLANILSFILKSNMQNYDGRNGLKLIRHLETTTGGCCKVSSSEQNLQAPLINLGNDELVTSLNI